MSHPYLPLFALPQVVEDLLRGFIFKDRPELDDLDFNRMTRVPDDWVPEGPRYADLVWSIPFRTSEPQTAATHMLLILKCESTVVPDMGQRLDRHAASLCREVSRRRAFGRQPSRPW